MAPALKTENSERLLLSALGCHKTLRAGTLATLYTLTCRTDTLTVWTFTKTDPAYHHVLVLTLVQLFANRVPP